MADPPEVSPVDQENHTGNPVNCCSSFSRRQSICFVVSILTALVYGLMYWKHRIGVSPFHISKRLPDLDWFVLAVTVVAPLVVGILCGFLSGRGKWYALVLYPIVVMLSLF